MTSRYSIHRTRRRVSQSVVVVCQGSIDQGNLMEKWSIDQGNQMSVTSRKHRFGPHLKKQRQTILAARNASKSVITNSKHPKPMKSADSFKDNYGNRNWNLVKLINEVLQRWKKLRKFQSSSFDTMARRKLIEDQNTILELSGRVQELQNEVNCMNDSQEFQDAESIRSGNSYVTKSTSVIPTSSNTWRDVETFFRNAVPQRRAAKHLGHTWYIGKLFFANPDASSSAPYPQELHQWNSPIEEPLHSSTVEKSERQKDQDLRCQSGPSAKDSVIFSGGDYSKNYGADQQWLQISDLHFRQVPYTSSVCLLEDKVQDRGMYLFTISYGSYAVDQRSGDGWISGFFKKNFVINYEVFQCRILKYLTRKLLQRWTKSSIILTSREESVWRNKRPRSRTVSFVAGRMLTWSTNTSGSLEPMILSRTMPTFSLSVYEMETFRNSIQSGTEFLLSMTKIPPDDILEGLYTLRIRESENSRPYNSNCMTWRFIEEVRTWLTEFENYGEEKYRAIEMNFGARNGNFEKNAVVLFLGTKQRVQRILGDCWQLETNGKCVKGDNCSFRHDINKRGKVTPSNPSPNSFMQQNERKSSRTRSPRGRSPSGRTSRWPCKDYFRGTCSNSFCEKWHPPECLFYKTKSGCRFGEKCSYAHRQVDEQPTKRSKTNNDKSAVAMLKKGNWHERGLVADQGHDRLWKSGKKGDKKLERGSTGRRSSNARQLCCVFQDMTPPKSIHRKGTDMQRPIQRVKFTKAIAGHTKIRHQNPSLGYICPDEPHQRSPNAPKFEDRSQEETEWQDQGAREAAWKLAKSVFKLKQHERATFFSPSQNRCLPASNLKLEEQEFVVDSGASMHMISQCIWSAKRTWVMLKWILWRNCAVLR